MTKKKSTSSRRWLLEHRNDPYVRLAQRTKLRSRAWFKLDEIQQSDKLLKKGMIVLDLGASPGSWSQYAKDKVGDGKVLACDLLPMEPIAGVDFVLGDCSDAKFLHQLDAFLGTNKVDLVMSDMSPNLTGNRSIDIPRSIYLAETALDVACKTLAPKGAFVVKVFQGEGFDAYLRQVRSLFERVKIRKPNASRARSAELYIVAIGFK